MPALRVDRRSGQGNATGIHSGMSIAVMHNSIDLGVLLYIDIHRIPFGRVTESPLQGRFFLLSLF
jgi:hypothetical protein